MELRNEIKFNLNDSIAKIFLNKSKTIKQFSDRQIHSIYYEKSNFKFFTDSEEGTVPRKKIRYRWYNENFEKGILEIKKTLSTHREKIKKKTDINDLKNKLLLLGLKPVLKVSYIRQYFVIDKLRFTFDKHITYKKVNQYLRPIVKVNVQDNIIELKSSISTDYSIILQDIIQYRTRYSKYCEGIKRLYV